MANRYWVGGAGTWDTTSTTNWSTASGGASGASVPTSVDSVFFDQAGTYTVTCTGALNCLDMTVSAGTVTFAQGTSPTFGIYGSMTLIAGTLWPASGAITFLSTSTGRTVTTNGVSFAAQIVFNSTTGGWTLGSALTTSSTVNPANGTLNTSASNYSITCQQFSNTGLVTSNASTISCSSTFTNNGTFTGTGIVSFIGASAKNFNGVSKTYNITLNQGGAGAVTVTGSNSFGDITNTYGSTGATSILFTAGTTNTFTNWSANGTAGKLLTISSPTAATHTLSKASGIVSASYLNISYSTATGGAIWNAYTANGNVNSGNNTGWVFGASGNFFFLFS